MTTLGWKLAAVMAAILCGGVAVWATGEDLVKSLSVCMAALFWRLLGSKADRSRGPWKGS